jgi:hypothetical protein
LLIAGHGQRNGRLVFDFAVPGEGKRRIRIGLSRRFPAAIHKISTSDCHVMFKSGEPPGKVFWLSSRVVYPASYFVDALTPEDMK